MRRSARRSVERLRVGIGDDEVDALHVGAHHVGDGVAARAADADHADPRAQLVDFRPDEIDAHAKNSSPQCDNALSLQDEILNHRELQAKRKKLTPPKKVGKSVARKTRLSGRSGWRGAD